MKVTVGGKGTREKRIRNVQYILQNGNRMLSAGLSSGKDQEVEGRVKLNVYMPEA